MHETLQFRDIIQPSYWNVAALLWLWGNVKLSPVHSSYCEWHQTAKYYPSQMSTLTSDLQLLNDTEAHWNSTWWLTSPTISCPGVKGTLATTWATEVWTRDMISWPIHVLVSYSCDHSILSCNFRDKKIWRVAKLPLCGNKQASIGS